MQLWRTSRLLRHVTCVGVAGVFTECPATLLPGLLIFTAGPSGLTCLQVHAEGQRHAEPAAAPTGATPHVLGQLWRISSG